MKYFDDTGLQYFYGKLRDSVYLDLVIPDGAGAHNSIYRGKYLGSAVTDEQYANISNGTFKGLYIGDYWTINGFNWRIAAFDYYLNVGSDNVSTHHVTIVPDGALYIYTMNDTVTTDTGYANSKMRIEGLETAKTTINGAFGEAHVLSHKQRLSNAAIDGCPSADAWYDSTVELMNEINVYGHFVLAAHDITNGIAIYSIDKTQFPLFALCPNSLATRGNYWLRDVSTATDFCVVGSNVDCFKFPATAAHVGVRPRFSIC